MRLAGNFQSLFLTGLQTLGFNFSRSGEEGIVTAHLLEMNELKMTSITEVLQHKHRECDDLFAQAESAAANQDWPVAAQKWQEFTSVLDDHITVAEEEILFPALESANGPMGPIQVMRHEHEQMRVLVAQAQAAVAAKDREQFLGLSDTLMVLMQQHNMKEEQILYPMIQRGVPNAVDLIS